ncbi:hypothetical protein IG631_16250 [Alternaria alternata]|nr:hypothetical protein IG631_16250 [Alternaria alternata]
MASVSNHDRVLPSFAVPHAVQHRLAFSCHRFQRVSFAAELSSNGPPCSQQSSTPPFHPPYPSLGRTRGSLQRGCNNTAHSACASSYCEHMLPPAQNPPTRASYAANPAVTDQLPGDI